MQTYFSWPRRARASTKAMLEMLRRRAYSRAKFERLAGESAFGACDIQMEGMSLAVRFNKH
jgi:hypothetical protein